MKTFIKALIVVLIVGFMKVNAATVTDVIKEGNSFLSGEYVVKQVGNVRHYRTMNIIVRQSDGHFVYCLEPEVLIQGTSLTGYDSNQASHINVSESVWQRIMLLSYYGYGYTTHTDTKWYVVTQFMIWQSVGNPESVFFTDTLNGNKITKYQQEMKEMETLIANHKKIPSFNNQTYKTTVGKNLEIKDTNNVISGYKISSSPINSKISGNSLSIEANKTGKYTINLTKNNNRYGVLPIVYVDPNTQNALFRGDVPSQNASLKVEINGGSITINKKGEAFITGDANYYEDIPLAGIELAIFNEKDQLIANLTTDNAGKAIYSNLELGKYYIKETKTKDNYVLDENIYPFEITKDNLNISLDLKNHLIKGHLEFSKTDLSTSKGLPNTLIEIYNDQDVLIFNGKTDKNGFISINDLPIGRYYILEKEAPLGYILNDEKMYFEITDNNEIVKATMTNKKITGTLIFTKKDASTGKVIPNCTISIYDENDKMIFTGITDENGEITFENIPYGKYYFKETNAPKGYILNPEKMHFEIIEDGQIIKSSMVNEIIKVPDTLNNKDFMSFSVILGGLILHRLKSKRITLVCFLLLLGSIYQNISLNQVTNNNLLASSFNKEKTSYIAYLEIPKINLYRPLTLDENDNNVDKNIEILAPFIFPDSKNSNLILAGHSGNADNAYFNDLINLKRDDTIYLHYNNKIYKYKLDNIYEIDKTGYANIQRDQNRTTLTMITCKLNENKQIIFISYLQEVINKE